MTDTLEQLLLLARFDSQKPTIQNEKESPPKIVNEVIANHSKTISSKNLKVIFNSQGIKNDLVPSYYSHLILDNIILNAIKYSKENSQIAISLNRNESGLECAIKDEGIGIKKEDLEKIFIPFFRSEALNHRNIIGNGLGLSIAKKAALAINASITVESELNKGTRFLVTF